jgi:DNA-binding GntR family transcriptional regulator
VAAADGAPLRPDRRATLADGVADAVAEAIATRRLAPGERLVETALAGRLGVSRIPVREALKVLQAQGILAGERNRGYRVAAFGAETERQVYEVRLALETVLLRDALAAWRAGRGSPAVLDGPLAAMDAAARAADVAASLRADLDFHRAVRRAAGNEVAGALWDAIARHVLIVFSSEAYRTDDLALVAAQHRELRDWIAARVADPPPDDVLRARLEDHLFQVIRARRERTRAAAPARDGAAAPAPETP